MIRNNPAPGTEAARLKEERDRKKAESKGEAVDGTADPVASGEPAAEPEVDRRPPQRQQPKRQSKSQRQAKGPRTGGTTPAGNQRAQNEKRNGNKS